MKPKLRDEWVAALRSGNYTQGKGRLRKGDTYCCLGVLCDVMGLEWILDPHYEARDIESDKTWEYAVPAQAAASIDLSDNVQSHLTSKNDDEGCNFSEIADWIEENL